MNNSKEKFYKKNSMRKILIKAGKILEKFNEENSYFKGRKFNPP